MTLDIQGESEERLRRALHSSPLPPSLTSHERLAQLRIDRRRYKGNHWSRVTPIHALAGLGSIAAVAAAAVLAMNGLGDTRMVQTDGGASAARAQAPASEPTGQPSVEAVYEVPTYNFSQGTRLARIRGRLGGQLVGDVVCLWIEGAQGARNGLILQTGSAAKLNPLRLVQPDGHVVATEGDLIQGTGGNSDKIPTGCEGLVSGQSTMVGVVNLSTQGIQKD